MLVAQGLVKRFGGIHAVDGIDLAVKDRTLHALIGPNGAGKTTAFNLSVGPLSARCAAPSSWKAARSPA